MKKLLVSLILCLGFIPCFSSALTLTNENDTFAFQAQNTTVGGGQTVNLKSRWNISYDGVQCFFADQPLASVYDGENTYTNVPAYVAFCTNNSVLTFTTSTTTWYWYSFVKGTWFEQMYPNYTSLQCQTEYNLIPISEVDANYCESNNLCSSSSGPSDCPNVGVSNVFINDIFHPGAFNVIINIPEEIDWDYAYTNSGNNINIDVVGYNQDTEYINGWIDTNNYKPTSDDFTNTFLLFKDYSGLLIALLFIILVFYFVKKLF